MRQHKYRAWDNNSKEWINPDFIHLLGNGSWSWWDEINEIEAHNGDSHGSQAFLMEFSGLKDESGKSKDWWEDDILHPIDGSDRIGIIAYNERFAEYQIQDETDNGICSLGAACCDGWHLIGNVHEHPELLEQ